MSYYHYDNNVRAAGAKIWENHFSELTKALRKKDAEKILELYEKGKELNVDLLPGSEMDKKSLAYRLGKLESKCNDFLMIKAYG